MSQLSPAFSHTIYNSVFRQTGAWVPNETWLHWLTKMPDAQGPETRAPAATPVRIDHDAAQRNFFETAATGRSIANTATISTTATAAVQGIVGIGLYSDQAGTNLLASDAYDDGQPRDLALDDVIEFRPGELTIAFAELTNPPPLTFALNAFTTTLLNAWIRRDAVSFPSVWHVGLLDVLPTTRAGASMSEADHTPRAQLLAASLGAPSDKVGSNTAIIRHPAATNDEPNPIIGAALYDAATGGTPYLAGAFLPPGYSLDVNQGDQPQVDVGRLSIGVL